MRPDLNVPSPFPRMTYAESMRRFGTDKPDLRYGLELVDFTNAVRGTEFVVFKRAVESGGAVEGICVPGGAEFSRKEIDALTETVKGLGAKGLVSIAYTASAVRGDRRGGALAGAQAHRARHGAVDRRASRAPTPATSCSSSPGRAACRRRSRVRRRA